MKVRELIENYRGLEYKLSIEFRQNNYFLKEERIDDVDSIDIDLVNEEVNNWFADFNQNIIVVDINPNINQLNKKIKEKE